MTATAKEIDPDGGPTRFYVVAKGPGTLHFDDILETCERLERALAATSKDV